MGVALLVLCTAVMHAREMDCLVTRLEFLAPSILRIVFRPSQPFLFKPGQFLSIRIPGTLRSHKGVKRCYSFALNPVLSKVQGYEICVKLVEGGVGTTFLKNLRVGDRFRAFAPYGHFQLPLKTKNRNLVLISTGTGIAPFRSMLGSKELETCGYRQKVLVHGVRFENELIYIKDFQSAGVSTHFVVSQPGPLWAGRKGRVTDLLQNLARNVNFGETDFFICGNGEMVESVVELLTSLYRVSESRITRENFSSKVHKKAA